MSDRIHTVHVSPYHSAQGTAEQLARMGAMPTHDAWQPIDTAPRDGALIIAYRPQAWRTGDPEIVIAKTTKYPSKSPQGVEHYTNHHCHPTHWMPLPEPPRYCDTCGRIQHAHNCGERE